MAKEDKIAAGAADATSVEVTSKTTASGSAPEDTTVVKQETPAAEAVAPASLVVAPTVEAPSAPVVESTSESAVKVKETSAVENVAGVQQSAPRSGSPTALTIMAQWDSYIERAAKSRPQTKASSGNLRDEIINLIGITVNLEESRDFVQVSNYLLKEIKANSNGCFSLNYVFREFESLSGATANKPRFALDAYMCFADPDTRATNIVSYNLQNAAQLCKTEELRTRFVAYFNRISGKR